MKADITYQKPGGLVPLDEINIKTKYTLKIQKRIQQSALEGEDFRLSNVHLAMFWSAPLSAFRDGGKLEEIRAFTDGGSLLVIPKQKRRISCPITQDGKTFWHGLSNCLPLEGYEDPYLPSSHS
ncbi:hypothetical protein CDV31_015399 [Fusarium ambrosium]|uniref:Uncharacterized protein n=1 Tax=Fusarium ambrosium TaxID=131363 RepID=A0A428SPK2_9HYPO|nr:hypothetical protein CDV31_015399 [Fusarium ambrosium]